VLHYIDSKHTYTAKFHAIRIETKKETVTTATKSDDNLGKKAVNYSWHTAKWQACLRRHSKFAFCNTNGKWVIVTIKTRQQKRLARHIGSFCAAGNLYLHIYVHHNKNL
jgi:hypothetical protein